MNKNVIPDDFTLSLVLVDAIPVLFFALNMALLGLIMNSSLFIIGALLCLYAGITKVLWKLIVVLKKKNIWWMFVQMRYVMPIGFVLMIISFFTNGDVEFTALGKLLLSMPSVLFFAAGLIGMGLMMYFMFNLDSSDLKSNWIEQITNGISQASFFVGLLLIVLR